MVTEKKGNKKNIHGVVLLDKPMGMSSNRALQKVKHLFGAKKAGHTGSLDPLATGLLPLCFGQATKVSEYLLGSSKRYSAVIKLGETTDTLDAEGKVLQVCTVAVSDAQLQAALAQFRGDIEQIPPMYSALKKGGQPLYKLARKGEEVERAARKMTVHELGAERIDDTHVRLQVHCSSGFYIRSLADDLGQALGCGAHIVELRRTAIKQLDLAQAVTLAELEQSDSIQQSLLPIEVLVQDFPRLVLDEQQVDHLSHGRRPAAKALSAQGLCCFYTPHNELFGIGEISSDGTLKTHKRFVLDE